MFDNGVVSFYRYNEDAYQAAENVIHRYLQKKDNESIDNVLVCRVMSEGKEIKDILLITEKNSNNYPED